MIWLSILFASLSWSVRAEWRTAVLDCSAVELNRSRTVDELNRAAERFETGLQLGVECEMANAEGAFPAACFVLWDELWACSSKELLKNDIAQAQKVCGEMQVPQHPLALPRMLQKDVESRFHDCRKHALRLNELLEYKKTGHRSGF